MNYYGGLSEGVDGLSQELLADISHFSFNTVRDGKFIPALPVSVRFAMLHLSKELKRLAPLAMAIDNYMQNDAEIDDVIEQMKLISDTDQLHPTESIGS